MNKTRPRRVGLRQVAEACGVSVATVSLSLRGSSALPAKTRDRVVACAHRLGYRVDPVLGKLMAYLRGTEPPEVHAALSVLSLYPEDSGWRDQPFSRRQIEVFERRAASLGYRIECFHLRAPRMTPRRLREILIARGIEGIILPGAPAWQSRLEFDFSGFAVAALGHSIVGPFHRACQHQYAEMFELLDRLAALGYRRPGLVLSEDTDLRTLRHYSSAFLWGQSRQPLARRVPLLTLPEVSFEAFSGWFRRNRPDVVLAQRPPAPVFLDWLRELGAPCPEHTGFVSLDVDTSIVPAVSGIVQDYEGVSAAAVDLVVAQIHRNEKGLPASPKVVMIQGHWTQGETVRPKPGALRLAGGRSREA